MNLDALFDRRLLMVVGKGGVGKTTVACTLALEAARRGQRALLCEVDGAARAAQLFGVKPAPIGEAREARPGIWLMPVEGKAALAEYLGLIIPMRRFLQAVFSNRIYQYFVAVAPGLKELMTVGKIWYEAERRDKKTGELLWDLVIVDAPATGHSLQYLRMPAAARAAFGTGLVQREAQRLVEVLSDPSRTAINLVTTAEEMPVNETVSMARQLCDDLRMPPGILFVNRLHYDEFTEADLQRLAAAAKNCRDSVDKQMLLDVAARAREETGWARLNRCHKARLAKDVAMPMLEMPFLFAEEFGFGELRRLADHLLACQHPEERARPA